MKPWFKIGSESRSGGISNIQSWGDKSYISCQDGEAMSNLQFLMLKPREIHIEPAAFMVKTVFPEQPWPGPCRHCGKPPPLWRRLGRHAERRDGSVKPKNDAEK